MYSVLYTVYSVLLSPLWLKSVPGWPAISVSTSQQSRVGQIVWFRCLSAILQIASRVGEGGGVRHFFLHSVTQYTGGLCSLPLLHSHSQNIPTFYSTKKVFIESIGDFCDIFMQYRYCFLRGNICCNYFFRNVGEECVFSLRYRHLRVRVVQK